MEKESKYGAGKRGKLNSESRSRYHVTDKIMNEMKSSWKSSFFRPVTSTFFQRHLDLPESQQGLRSSGRPSAARKMQKQSRRIPGGCLAWLCSERRSLISILGLAVTLRTNRSALLQPIIGDCARNSSDHQRAAFQLSDLFSLLS